jgi:hypothetical protein
MVAESEVLTTVVLLGYGTRNDPEDGGDMISRDVD